jgi:hypothetical protein
MPTSPTSSSRPSASPILTKKSNNNVNKNILNTKTSPNNKNNNVNKNINVLNKKQ